ncbi:2-succinyl-5-enolpyruvyl-6-hydroxy-3-cyclohexene-1-carboxylic-acid synthase [Reinekea sp.]|jgi:2-succinyl-5-enolpyruvyl-6-hydroxy-3-cyclohexene-1-carboxylate synthase|uniref:2-succinyl-5-enolpyruvyl-6-hydroxy-3- cyclohexene-1-carboxylic-acid synthase n=1 Tax=Reinekea sp. TaxID=1970455 RepID=UPI002A7FBB20|nr:2-succinyl-5-enolpyruvyl-6-hydroxy-3-cyclohexene-1-carboxylic-acid synthase [Reinekea sp.]
MRRPFSNINQVWSWLLLERLYGSGVRHICLAPGSRSAPLVLALVELGKTYPDLILHTHFDERGLGFLALGLSKASAQAVAVITTSGTAVANLLPAVIEARHSHVPLILISADRPDELLDCGANQAIAQQQLFGAQVLDRLSLPAPDSDIAIHSWLPALDRLLRTQGPVHINCPFREPLYPTEAEQDFSAGLPARMAFSRSRPTPRPVTPALDLTVARKTLIVAGQLSSADADRLVAFCQRYRLPILADLSSQLRLRPSDWVIHYVDILCNNADFVQTLNRFERVIQFSGRLISKRLLNWLGAFSGEHLLVDGHTGYLDPNRRALQQQQTLADFLLQLAEVPLSWPSCQVEVAALHAWNAVAATQLPALIGAELNEISAVTHLAQNLPGACQLFAGNSLSIRLLDMYAAPTAPVRVFSNRGASGIDGLIATAAGVAAGANKPLVLVIGDTSALYDLNSLALVNRVAARTGQAILVLVLNNNGGAIFNLLPAAQFGTTQRDYFQCPHDLDFAAAAAQFRLAYARPSSLSELVEQIRLALLPGTTSLIEIQVPAAQSSQQIGQINRHFAQLTGPVA